MKPTYLILGLALLFLLLISCQKTGSRTTPINYFEIDDQKHKIEKAAFVNLEDNPVLKDMKAILFISDGLSFDANSNRELKIRGKGKLMGFIIYSQNNEELENGDYFINLLPPFKEGDIALGFYDLDWYEKTGLILYEEGEATVVQKQDLADLKFNFTTEEGKILKGEYLGSLQKNLIYKTGQIEFDN